MTSSTVDPLCVYSSSSDLNLLWRDPLCYQLKDYIMSLRGGVNQWHNNFINFLLFMQTEFWHNILSWNPIGKNHKLFSINCKICFTCYIEGRCTSFFINTNWPGRTHNLVYIFFITTWVWNTVSLRLDQHTSLIKLTIISIIIFTMMAFRKLITYGSISSIKFDHEYLLLSQRSNSTKALPSNHHIWPCVIELQSYQL